MRTGTSLINEAAKFGHGTKRRNNLGGFTSLGAIDVQVAAIDAKLAELQRDLARDDLTPTQRNAKRSLAMRCEGRRASMVNAFLARKLEGVPTYPLQTTDAELQARLTEKGLKP